jgi:hypothetical protein
VKINKCPYCHKQAFPLSDRFSWQWPPCQNCGKSVAGISFLRGLVGTLLLAVLVFFSFYAIHHAFPAFPSWPVLVVLTVVPALLVLFAPLAKTREQETQ